MALKKFILKPGLNREQTSYKSEGTWYDCDHIRFRNGDPEKIGGWEPISAKSYLGVSRTLFNWATLGGQNLVGVGTDLKMYIENGGDYYDITPLRDTVSLSNPFDTTNGDETVVVTDVAHGAFTGDFVTFSGASAVGGLDLNGEYQITKLTDDTYSIEAATPATSTANGGGATVSAAYQLHIQNEISVPITGFGSGPYGAGPWGIGSVTTGNLGMWSQSNFGEDLIFNQFNGQLCIWDASLGTSVRGTLIEDDISASGVPLAAFLTVVSDINRFVFAFGCNDIGSATLDPMLIRWSDQEDCYNWTPAATNQAGSLRLSTGSEIVAAIQARQEILVWTDAAVYSLQYLGAADGVWGAQIVGDNTSIVGPNAVAYANGVAFWMGIDRFYRYDGTVQPLRCDVRRYVFNNFNLSQRAQVTCGTNESFNEIWWFYPSANSDAVDRYVIYNYLDDIWYYGTTARTAWIDSKLRRQPLAATYNNNLVYHELGLDDDTTGTPVALNAYVESGQFDLDDGQRLSFGWRMLPDLTFVGSTAGSPQVTVSLTPMLNSGSGYNSPTSVGGSSFATTTLTLDGPPERYTGQVDIRVRGRQMTMRIESDMTGVAWQWGAPRLDLRPDGRR